MTRCVLGLSFLLIIADDQQKRAISYLTQKIEECRPRAGQMKDGEQNLSALTAAVSQLKSLSAKADEISKDLETQKFRVRSYENTDLGPKKRAMDKVDGDYKDRVDAAWKAAEDFKRANDKKWEEGTAQAREAQAQLDRLVARYNELVNERDQKKAQATLTYAAAQKEYGERLVKRDRLQEELTKISEEFSSVHGDAMHRVNLLNTALYQLRQAGAVAADLVKPGGTMAKKRPSGDVFDEYRDIAPVALPDPPVVDGRPAEMVLPPALLTEKAASASPRIQEIQRERAAVQQKSLLLEGVKARLFVDKNATQEMWTDYAKKARENAREAAEVAMKERGIGGTQTMDKDELFELNGMGAKPQREPPAPEKGSNP